jgi:hypothetical protein
MKKLFYLLLALPMLMVACDPEPTPEPVEKSYELKLTSEAEMNFEAEGGQGTIKYALVEQKTRVDAAKVAATCEAAWVTDLAVAENITFNVAANEGEARETKVVVTYGEQKVEVAVKQAAKAVDTPTPEPSAAVELPFIEGTYYAPYYWGDMYDAHNFYIMLSSVDDLSSYQPNASYLQLDIWAASGDASNPVVPAGEYVFDATDSSVAGTVGCYYSVLVVTDASGATTEIYPCEGKVVVSENKIEVTFTDINDDEYAFVYNGVPALPVAVKDAVEINGEGYYAEVSNYGDFYGVGADNYIFTFAEYPNVMNGEYIIIEILVDPALADYTGEYTVLASENDVMGKFVSGYSGGYLVGSWYIILENGSISDVYQPIYDGTITIARNEDDTTTFTLNCTDDLGNSITGSITSEVLEVEAQALSVSKKASRFSTMTRKSVR